MNPILKNTLQKTTRPETEETPDLRVAPQRSFCQCTAE